MKRFFVFCLFLCTLFPLYTQVNPGAVGTANLTAWFKPDLLATGAVTSWSTTLPSGSGTITLTDASTPYPILTNTPAGNSSNYNKTLSFLGNSPLGLKALQNTGTMNLLNNSSAASEGTFFIAYYVAENNFNGHMLLYNEPSGSSDAIQCRTLGSFGRIAIGKGANSNNKAREWTENYRPSIVAYTGNHSGTATMKAYLNTLPLTNTFPSSSTGPGGMYIGTKPGEPVSEYNGYIHELIFYNRDLSGTELSKVHTYLAIKYGITLDNTGGGINGDYVATNSTVIWDESDRPAYHTDVIGIGRDDDEGLLQKQSHAFDDVTRIYLGALATTNLNNTGSFISNLSYVVTGHNNAAVCATMASNAEIPPGCGLYSRLAREWKITKTNFSESFNMDITLHACAVPGSVNIAHLRLLVDDDGDFSNGGTSCYYNGDGTGVVISYSNPVITITGLTGNHMANNATSYITVGSILSATPLPVQLINFDALLLDNKTVDLSWQTASELNNDYFTVERSSDGYTWTDHTRVEGAGNSNVLRTYACNDPYPLPGTSYYRLKQTDFNEDFSYSQIRTIYMDDTEEYLSLFPNPADDILHIKANREELTEIHLYNNLGQDITSQTTITRQGENNVQVNLNRIIAGLYYIKTKTVIRKMYKK